MQWDGDELATGVLEGKGQACQGSAFREAGSHFHTLPFGPGLLTPWGTVCCSPDLENMRRVTKAVRSWVATAGVS